jgi:hypothetical protein
LLRALWPIIRISCDAVTVLGIAGLAVQLAAERLPVLLPAVVAHLAPGIRLEVGAVRFDAFGLALRRVRVRTATGEPILAAKRAVIRFSPWSLPRGHVDRVLLERPLVTPPATLPTFGGDSGATTWSIGRLVTRGGRFRMPARDPLPAASFRFVTDLRDLGSAPELEERLHPIDAKEVRVTLPDGAPMLVMRGARVEASLAGVRDRHRIDEVRLISPAVTVAGALPVLPGGGAEAADPPWTLGRLVLRDGRFVMSPSAGLPGVAFRVAADLPELGTAGDAAMRWRDLTARHLTATLPGGAPVLAVDAVVVRFSIAGLLGKRVEEIRLVAPAITVPGTLPAAGPAGRGTPAAGWSFGRLAAHEGAIRMTASGDLPNVVGTFSFDLRELGTDARRAALPQRVQVRDLRVRFAKRPTSLVVDEGSADFTLAGLLEHRQIARLRVDRGLVVLDRALRDRLGGGGGGGPRAGATAWSVAVLDLAQLGIRLADLGPEIPDLTLLIRSRLTDVPLAPAGLAKARTPQRIELSNITLDSPLDPFRPVVHVGSIFVEFSLAELLHRRLASLVVVSPTIYLGEDLIWYMNATRTEAAAAPPEEPWRVSRLRVDLGRLVLTFNGVDRAALPLNFRTDARNVTLGDLATLRLAAALEVPKQSYTFPGFDLELIDVEGELRFDYPPGQARDNVVNTLKVAEIRWRNYRIHHGWFSATFDAKGINGKLGGGAYDGYVNGGASLPFRAGPMAGWASCTDLDLAPLAAAAAGSYLEMTGLVDLEGSVEMVDQRIDQARADLDFKRPGWLSFPALDRLLERLPPAAVSWQRDLARIAIETFRDYPYATGKGTLRFAGARGEAHLTLDGERGKRQFDVHYYDEGAPVIARTAREEEE